MTVSSAMATLAVFTTLSSAVSALSLPQTAQHAKRAEIADWSGWASIQSMFVFGDSYTTTNFNASTGPQPNASNPLGNPPYPGYTSSNGPNWVDFLTTTYNASLIETYNLAFGGATVDSALVAPYLPTVLSLRQQIEDEFLPIYSPSSDSSGVAWDPSTTLFALWIGINDVGNSYSANFSSIKGEIFTVYAHVVDELYAAGARNYLFVNVPPVDRSPGTTVYGANASALEAAAISIFNTMTASLVKNLTSTYADASAFLFDSNTLFNCILDDPGQYPETAGLLNTTSYCVGYENGTPTMDYFNASCGIPVNEYFWLNTLHPTYPTHNLTARVMGEVLEFSIPV